MEKESVFSAVLMALQVVEGYIQLGSFRVNGNAADLPGVHRIAHKDKTFFHTAEKPVRITGGDICSSADAEDHSPAYRNCFSNHSTNGRQEQALHRPKSVLY